VAVEILIPCYHCNWCKEGKYRLCGKDDTSQTGGYGRQFGCNIPLTREPIPLLWGGFSQYLFIPREAIIHKYKKGVNVKAAVMTKPFATAIHTIERAEPLIGEACAILGLVLILAIFVRIFVTLLLNPFFLWLFMCMSKHIILKRAVEKQLLIIIKL